MDLVKISRSEKLVIVRELPFVSAKIANRSVKFLMERTARVVTLGVVDNPIIVIDEGKVISLVAQIGEGGPAVDIGLGEPDMIHAEAAARVAVAKHHDTFAHGF